MHCDSWHTNPVKEEKTQTAGSIPNGNKSVNLVWEANLEEFKPVFTHSVIYLFENGHRIEINSIK